MIIGSEITCQCLNESSLYYPTVLPLLLIGYPDDLRDIHCAESARRFLKLFTGHGRNKMMMMSRLAVSCRLLAVAGALSMLAACADSPPPRPPHPVAANPPPVEPGHNAVWHTVSFDTNSYALDANAQKVIGDVVAALQVNPATIATIIGKTDTVGSNDYNMHLSHQRADAVRDALVYGGKVPAARVETRWTGETRQDLPTANGAAAGANRVVDIAIH
jgi:hypothetical protein